ncbi:hypothetical protein B0I37DRAFT_413088 [Chaetomium sp. MPI-CAGE-AT-0009]|nr:hypothetical protein B0I37DRAFT_413088 [Chaetomium sp. MPI-CAGE-AT-0009]
MPTDDEVLANEMEILLKEVLERQQMLEKQQQQQQQEQQNIQDWITRGLATSAMVAVIVTSVVLGSKQSRKEGD